MSSPFPLAKAEVDYPLYAVDFDPEDPSCIIVGGGGGAGRSGVPNKITVLKAASPTELRVTGQVDLPRDEDSVMSLAASSREGRTIRLFAGVNSSPEEIEKGHNSHLRSIAVRRAAAASPSSDAAPTLVEEARHSLFTNPAGDVYQRLLRVSGSLAAAGSGFGKDPQIALFDPAESAGAKLVRRGTLELGRDAEDLDLLQVDRNRHLLAYCFKHELYLVEIDRSRQQKGRDRGGGEREPVLIYTVPADEPDRPAFRAVRFLSPQFLVAVANLPGRRGVVIHGYRLPAKLAAGESARLAISASIPRKMAATAVAVATLTRSTLAPPPSTLSSTRSAPAGDVAPSLGDAQFVVAVAGHDSSVSLYSLTHVASPSVNLLTRLHPLATVEAEGGGGSITGLNFAAFHPPTTKTAAATPQFLTLASVSLQKTVTVYSIPLKRFVDRSPRHRNAPPRPTRYVTALAASEPAAARTALVLLALVVVLLAIVGQAILGRTRARDARG